MDAGDDFFLAVAVGQQADDLGFGEHGAGAVDGQWRSLAVEVIVAEFLEIDVEVACGNVEEAAGAGSAFVVHGEVGDVALVVKLDGLRVLATDIDNGAHAAEGPTGLMGADSVGGDFRNGVVGLLEQFAAVTGGDQVLDLLAIDAMALEQHT